MSTFKIASKFKTEEEKKAEHDAILEAAWNAVPEFKEKEPDEAKKKAEVLAKCDYYNRIMESMFL